MVGGTRERRRRRLRRFVEDVLVGGDPELLDDLWGEGHVERKWGEEFTDYESFRQWVAGATDRFDDLDIEIESLLIDGRHGTARCQWRGETAQEYYGIVPAGQSFDVPMTIHVEFDADDQLIDYRTDVDLLELLPKSSRYARASFVQTVEEGVIVVGTDDTVTDINDAAVEAFRPDADETELLGEPLSVVLPQTDQASAGETTDVQGRDGRQYEMTVSRLEDHWENLTGRVLVFRDVTERRRRVQQLQVLSRVLRHNIRNDLNVVLGRLETALHDTTQETVTEQLRAAHQQAESLLATAETAREVQGVIGQTRRRRRDLVVAVKAAVARFHEEYPFVTVETALPDRLPVEVTDPLPDAIYELVENAWEHGGTSPRVDVSTDEETAVVSIRDEGPGFPERELIVIEEGEETQLKHGSGLGLWFVRWVVTASGGELSVKCADGETVVTVRLPLADTVSGVAGE